MIATIITFVIVIGLLIFVHELGHFLAAKRAGVRVDEFGFGFPPRIFGVQRGDTLYSLNWIPLGGFVRMREGVEHDGRDPESFAGQPLWRRAVITLAGVAMNLVFAWVLLTIGYLIGLPRIADELPAHARVRNERIQVMQTLPGSPAALAGIQGGDAVLSVDAAPIATVEQFREHTRDRVGTAVTVVLERAGEELVVEVTPADIEGLPQPGIGVALVPTGLVSYPLWYAPVAALVATADLTWQVAGAFAVLITDLVSARSASMEFSGPVGIAVLTGEVAELGFRHLLQFTALLSVNLAIINVLPIPALDGGRLVFLFAELLRGKATSRRVEAMAYHIGFSLLLLLILMVTYRDLVRYGDAIWSSLMTAIGA